MKKPLFCNRCVSINRAPTPQAVDDADVRYDVVGFWMSEPKERVLGSGRTPREAVDAALNTEHTG